LVCQRPDLDTDEEKAKIGLVARSAKCSSGHDCGQT
jgi:hypothetical protein